MRRHIEVAQCKCSENFDSGKVRGASDEFFKHYDSRWSRKGVNRFLLLVACALDDRNCRDQTAIEKGRFKEYGIEYEVWAASLIRNRLAPHASIVRRYLPYHWVSDICGEYQPPPIEHSGRTPLAVSVLTEELEQLGERFSDEVESKLESMRQALRLGRLADANDWVRQLRTKRSTWSRLSQRVQARIIRFQVGVVLDLEEGTEAAKELLAEARELDPDGDDTRQRAVVAFHEAGAEKALDVIGDRSDTEILNLKALLLINLRKFRFAIETLHEDGEPKAESHRIRALGHCMLREIAAARLEIKKALELEPNWPSVKFTVPQIDYVGALSRAVPNDAIFPWPQPIEWSLVKRDDESTSNLREAQTICCELAKTTQEPGGQLRLYEAWHLAVLANNPQRLDAAVEYCKTLLGEDPAHYPAIAWAAGRQFEVDLQPSRENLLGRLTADDLRVEDVLALAACYLASDEHTNLVRLLREQQPVFVLAKQIELWTLWYAQALLLMREPDLARVVLEQADEESASPPWSLIMRARADPESDRKLESLYDSTGDGLVLFELLKMKAQQGDWPAVADRAEELIKKVETADAVEFGLLVLLCYKKPEPQKGHRSSCCGMWWAS